MPLFESRLIADVLATFAPLRHCAIATQRVMAHLIGGNQEYVAGHGLAFVLVEASVMFELIPCFAHGKAMSRPGCCCVPFGVAGVAIPKSNP